MDEIISGSQRLTLKVQTDLSPSRSSVERAMGSSHLFDHLEGAGSSMSNSTRRAPFSKTFVS